mmetsp:Transcript_47494/g.79545  ORF Transcript_47494/g.79545 Transcript_47494/m.79545 type:complete len:202 (-) Transcript_47494:90-695(-)
MDRLQMKRACSRKSSTREPSWSAPPKDCGHWRPQGLHTRKNMSVWRQSWRSSMQCTSKISETLNSWRMSSASLMTWKSGCLQTKRINCGYFERSCDGRSSISCVRQTRWRKRQQHVQPLSVQQKQRMLWRHMLNTMLQKVHMTPMATLQQLVETAPPGLLLYGAKDKQGLLEMARAERMARTIRSQQAISMERMRMMMTRI